ncbi:efflux RND transporter periplasmic adaptor subunit [Parvibaculum sp.]|uniref:efflux RND transporter periplasmic adaptor subunit n=1 Tax=Parvibaculum sp. TaxID=2024848 RepID=UPI002731FBFD|nr:efflux RND transporter periplasmic adaptor subunit [Parvibaculum sp.]MDP1626264.1 efflux RND transporter periplasmic adaptor subunit [Parvibaculum sp.]MDP2151582.1 efflux RND transporter periplasmic adaptor subunit [Parvibaculum sp.]MDP3329007.1 efflux RND transporter periplasmic adaptor subunit [Parvibaculum sp.]
MFERQKNFATRITGGRLHRSHFIAIGIGVAILLWFMTGLFTGSGPTSTTTAAEEDAANGVMPRVRVTESVASLRRGSVIIRGRTSAKRAVEVRAETQGSIAELPVEKGMRVAKGDVLCRIALNARDAQLAEAQALVKQRRLEYDASRQLAEKGYRAPTVAAGSKAAHEAAQARLKQMEIEVGQTNIVAPFDGVFDDRPVDVGDYMRVGDVCGLVVELDPLLIIGQVSEDRVGALQIGAAGTARLVTGETVDGRIHFVAKTADPATRTFRVELEVPNPDFAMRAGVTAEIIVPGNEVLAHRIPSSVIALDDNGVIGVRTVDDEGRVKFNRAQLVDDTPEGLWITGLPQKVTIITVGQDYVKEGQKVEAVPANQVGAAL